MSEVKAVSPYEAFMIKPRAPIPSFVIGVVNSFLCQRYKGRGCSVIIKQEELITAVMDREEKIERSQIFDNKWFDFEYVFEESGWEVTYSKPFREEAYFVFSAKTRDLKA